MIGFISRKIKVSAIASIAALILGNVVNAIDLGVTCSLAGHVLFLVSAANLLGSGLGYLNWKFESEIYGKPKDDRWSSGK